MGGKTYKPQPIDTSAVVLDAKSRADEKRARAQRINVGRCASWRRSWKQGKLNPART